MVKKTKNPTIRIPARILKREAEKAAKKMMVNEKKKERVKELKIRAQEKLAKQKERKNDRDEMRAEFLASPLHREMWGWIWIVLAGGLLAIFFSQTFVCQSIYHGFQWAFGVGAWIVPILLGAMGVFLLQKTKEQNLFSMGQIMAFLILFWAFLGIINLFVSHDESLALSHRYGGAMGFAIGFFFREFLGDIVTAVVLIGTAWISATIGFRIHWSQLFSKQKAVVKTEEIPEEIDIKKGVGTTESVELKQKPKSNFVGRFKNELEIVNSTKPKEAEKTKIELSLEEKDALTEAKNRKIAGHWEPPTVDLLRKNDSKIVVNEKKLRQDAEKIREKLEQFGIQVTMKSVHVGPTVTQFTLEPAPGVKLTKITTLKNDLALTLASSAIRIEAPIRGESLVGIEIPNENRSVVSMREIVESDVWKEEKSPLKLAVGRNVSGKPIIVDLAQMPHLLIAGKTGSGKSVGMNAFLCSLLWNNSPEDLKLILIDPKRVELKRYDKLPHLLTPVIVEPEKSVSALAWAVAEMNRRYKMLAEGGVVNLSEYNEKFPEKKEPRIVIVIDELADLMMVAGKDVEAAVVRIAQLARAVGMHLMVATQRPSVDVVTGLIKANLPARIAFRVSSQIDSRTIIDGMGAEGLLGLGDMLYLDGNSGNLTRIQGIYISNDEVERLTNHLKLQFPEMMANDEITRQSIEGMAKGGVLTAGLSKEVSDEDLDDMFEAAVQIVLDNEKASASFLQRRMEIGYARAARLLDQMEAKGIVGPTKGAKPRDIYGRDL
jgi:S-DNA-T family DNA segregation ATPase FtsK/SpoIIIE